MDVRRAAHNRNYTVISNRAVNDKRLSLSAKGLLVFLLSLPPNWVPSVRGFAATLKEGETAIRAALQELQDCGYLYREKLRDSQGIFRGTFFRVYEDPNAEAPDVEKPDVEKPDADAPDADDPDVEVQAQIIKDIIRHQEKSKQEIRKKGTNQHQVKRDAGGQQPVTVQDKAKDAIDDYLAATEQHPEACLGYTKEAWSEAQSITNDLFHRFGARQPTWQDVCNVFFATKESCQDPATRQWAITYPKNKVDLLAYAFQAASNNGNAGKWNYIYGVLRKTRARTLESGVDAFEYDISRKMP